MSQPVSAKSGSLILSVPAARRQSKRARTGSIFGPNACGKKAMFQPGSNLTDRNRSALVTTDTELKLIAKAAKIGLSIIPKKG